jgi:transcription antitermination protein NusB
MATRRRAREIVLQLLYEEDLNPGRDEGSSLAFLMARLRGRKALAEFGAALLRGTRLHREAIDRELARHATHWSLTRMAVTDRNVLRLGSYEILFAETPDRVAINEAVEIAKRYGDRHSSRFVNGVLDRVLRSKGSEEGRLSPGEGTPFRG